MPTWTRTHIARKPDRHHGRRATRGLKPGWAAGIMAMLTRNGMIAAVDGTETSIGAAAALAFSRYAERFRVAHPQRFEAIRTKLGVPWQCGENEVAALRGAPDPASLAVALRRLRQQCYLITLLRDLMGRADLAEVCASTTRLAEVAITTAVT